MMTLLIGDSGVVGKENLSILRNFSRTRAPRQGWIGKLRRRVGDEGAAENGDIGMAAEKTGLFSGICQASCGNRRKAQAGQRQECVNNLAELTGIWG
jgi:hypothetical protein